MNSHPARAAGLAAGLGQFLLRLRDRASHRITVNESSVPWNEIARAIGVLGARARLFQRRQAMEVRV